MEELKEGLGVVCGDDCPWKSVCLILAGVIALMAVVWGIGGR